MTTVSSSILGLLLLLTISTTTNADPAVCPKDSFRTGYSDWAMLQADIDAVKTSPPPQVDTAWTQTLDSHSTTTESSSLEPVVFTICPDTTFRLTTNAQGNQGLYFSHASDLPPMIVRCGDNGLSSDNCVLRGGLHHVWMDNVGSLSFEGITFEAAQRGSVWMGTGQHSIHFDDCIWKDNTHEWTSAMGSPSCPNGCAAALAGRFGAANVTNCQFINNRGKSGTIYGEGMEYTIDATVFSGNKATWTKMEQQPAASAITLVNPNSQLALSNSCFLDNESAGAGTVKVDASKDDEMATTVFRTFDSSLTINKNNYFFQNAVSKDNADISYQYCHDGIYVYSEDADDVCLEGDATCCHATDAWCTETSEYDYGSSTYDNGSSGSSGTIGNDNREIFGEDEQPGNSSAAAMTTMTWRTTLVVAVASWSWMVLV